MGADHRQQRLRANLLEVADVGGAHDIEVATDYGNWLAGEAGTSLGDAQDFGSSVHVGSTS